MVDPLTMSAKESFAGVEVVVTAIVLFGRALRRSVFDTWASNCPDMKLLVELQCYERGYGAG